VCVSGRDSHACDARALVCRLVAILCAVVQPGRSFDEHVLHVLELGISAVAAG
jgi:hypothetical protein